MREAAQKARKAMSTSREPPTATSEKDFLSTGITLLNLATYGRTQGGLMKGKVYRLVGSSSSGKTFLARTILAEAAQNKAFDHHELIYDDVERGALMDTEKFFGKRLTDRLHPPATKDGEPTYSQSIGDFYSRLNKRLEQNKSVIWVEDSLDSLSPNAESKMSDGKAKANSQELRKLLEPLADTDSILILISQTRADLRSLWGGEIASGGRALEFYSTLEIWLKKIGAIKRVYKGKKYPVGIKVSARVKKNRISGQDRTIFFPFYPDYGIDDIGANVDFLISSNHWPSKGAIEVEEWNFQGDRRELISKVEGEGLQRELQVLVGKVWHEIEEACLQERKPRYEESNSNE